MATTVQPETTLIDAIQYDGTNAAAISTMLTAWNSLVYATGVTFTGYSEGGGNLTLILTGRSNMIIPSGDWIVRNGIGALETYTTTYYNQRYRDFPVQPTPPTDLAVGIATVPSINAGATANVVVTIKPSFADTNYTAVGNIIGSVTLLGQLQVNSVASTSVSTVTAVVKNNAIVTVSGGQILITAVHN